MIRRPHQRALLLLTLGSCLMAHAVIAAPDAPAGPEVQPNRPVALPAAVGSGADSKDRSNNGDASSVPPSETNSPSSKREAAGTTDAEADPARAVPARPENASSRPGPGGKRPREEPSTGAPSQQQLPLGRAPDTQQDGDGSDSDGGGWMLQTLGALGVVIALVLLMRVVIQRMGGGAAAAPGLGGLVEVLGRAPVGPRLSVLLLRINQRIVVASQSSSGLQPLTELTDPEEVADLLQRVEAARPRSVSRSFGQLLRRFERDHDGAAPWEEGTDHEEQHVDRTRDELSGLMSRIRTLQQRNR